ncbi:MAG: hypothetical protein CM1200mP18_12420 [Gammaproteobacteria bacterium]|nr:MAG: hypothetical protein CM1200mP18_12420 [Gammaproteobacteria bacterium]
MDAGAAGVMVSGIPGLKTDEQVYRYFSQVIHALGPEIPVCLQDYPPTTTVYLSVGVINRLITDFPSIKMFKHEDCPGHRKLSSLRRAPDTEGTRRVSILSGNGGLFHASGTAPGCRWRYDWICLPWLAGISVRDVYDEPGRTMPKTYTISICR